MPVNLQLGQGCFVNNNPFISFADFNVSSKPRRSLQYFFQSKKMKYQIINDYSKCNVLSVFFVYYFYWFYPKSC